MSSEAWVKSKGSIVSLSPRKSLPMVIFKLLQAKKSYMFSVSRMAMEGMPT